MSESLIKLFKLNLKNLKHSKHSDQSILGGFPKWHVEVRTALIVSSLFPVDHSLPCKDTHPTELAEEISIWQFYKD